MSTPTRDCPPMDESLWVKVSSSNILAVAYDPKRLVMELRFKTGEGKPPSHYRYYGVLAEHHAALLKAESVGKHFHAHIKGRYTDVERLA